MKPVTSKRTAFLIGVCILIFYGHTNAEWRRVEEFPGRETQELQKERKVPQGKEAYRNEASWKALSENEWGQGFYDAANIAYGENTCGGRVRIYLSEKYIKEKLPKLCKQVQGVRILEYRAEINCAEERVRIVSADLYSSREKRVASVPLSWDVEISLLEAADAALLGAFHKEICR